MIHQLRCRISVDDFGHCDEIAFRGILYAIIEHKEGSVIAVPLDRTRIHKLPEKHWHDMLTERYDGTLSERDGIEVPGVVKIFGKLEDGTLGPVD